MNMITRINPDAGMTLNNPTREEAEAAFRTIIRWAGDDPDRDGLAKTPARLARAFREYFSGYAVDLDANALDHLRGDGRLRRNDCPARHSVREPLRASRRADHRTGLGRLCADTAGWSAFPSWRGSSRPTPSGYRSRKR